MDRHLPRLSSTLSPSDPWAQPPQGHRDPHGASPSSSLPGCPSPSGCPFPSGCPCCLRCRSGAVGLGGLWGSCPWLNPWSCVPGSSQLPTWEERGEIWSAVAGDIGEGGPWGGGGGGGGRRWPTVSCLYERTVQTTCERKTDRRTDGERERAKRWVSPCSAQLWRGWSTRAPGWEHSRVEGSMVGEWQDKRMERQQDRRM